MQNKYSAIDYAFGKKDIAVYVISHHGRKRKFFSRTAAISNLAHFMVQWVFDKHNYPTHEEGETVEINGCITYRRGELTERYRAAHKRTRRRILLILSHKRKIREWNKKYSAWIEMRDELMKQKPF